MDRHDPNAVVIGLGQHGFGDPCVVGSLQARPLEIGPEIGPPCVHPGPRLVDDETQPPPDVTGRIGCHNGFEHTALAHESVEQFGRGGPEPSVVEVLHMAEAGSHGVIDVRLGDRIAQCETAVQPETPMSQIIITAAVDERAEGSDGGKFIGRVGDRSQREQEFTDLSGCVDERRGLGSIRHTGFGEGRLERRKCGAGRKQDADVAGPCIAPDAMFLDLPGCSFVEHRDDRRGHIAGLASSQFLGRRFPGERVGPEHGDGGPERSGVAAMGRQRNVLGLAVGREVDQLPEHMVHPFDDGSGGSEVHRERRTIGDLLARGEEHPDVGSPESVDRLLGIADEEQRAGAGRQVGPVPVAHVRVVGCDERCEFDLDRVGVLELVEEETGVALGQRCANLGTVGSVAQEAASPNEQIVKIESTDSASLIGSLEHEAADTSSDMRKCSGGDRRHSPVAGDAEIAEGGANIDDIDSPVALGSGVADPDTVAAISTIAHVVCEFERFDVIERTGEDGPMVTHIGKAGEQLVVGVVTAVGVGLDGVEHLEQLVSGERARRWRVEVEPLFDQVPVCGHPQGEGPQSVEANPCGLEDEE